MSSCTVIEPSERGAMVRLGQITSEKPIEPGIVWHYPFIESVEVFSIVPKTYEVTFSVSDDGATVAVRYNYDESRIIDIVKKYKTSYIIEDAMKDCIKASLKETTGKYSIYDIIANQEEITS